MGQTHKLSSEVVLITGSTSGIGLGIAEHFAGLGAAVVLNGFGDKTEIEAIRVRLNQMNSGKTLYFDADVTSETEIAQMFSETKKQLGDVSILINNAGIQHVSPIEKFPAKKWQQVIQVNLVSNFLTIQNALPAMKERGWGRIINIASAHGLIASPYKSAYVAAKHGVLGMTKTVALEVAEMGITCNAICPGYVRTPLVDGQIADTAKARGLSEEEVIRDVILGAQPTKKFVSVEEISGMAEFLCSDAAASITGTSQSMDGGWTAK
ncbi:MAG: 3-hydroxybutyrate dehydrogenase [Halobacteriovoraceae bacterium]|nr:3-hydroxybutyrate dehydrogenase [Halobacteriovoraceae bacterium]|tara:strand:+ start:4301 stop:5098 length:798 start_codon:yes stop_codon:yes gene_type:complete